MQSESKITLINYTKDNIQEKQLQSIDEILPYRNSDSITWVMVEGVDNTDIIKQMGDLFDIHPVALNNIPDIELNAKFDDHDNYLHIALRCLESQDEHFNITYEKVNILLFDNLVITLKEKTNDLFQPIMKRIKNNKGDFRSLGTDYLTYAIIDTIIDRYYILIAQLDKAVTSIEETMSSQPIKDTPQLIQNLKKNVITIRKNTSSVRELMIGVLQCESDLVLQKTNIYLKDTMDHLTHIINTIESYNDILTDLLDVHANLVSFKMNEVMQMLTLYATIFIPLTFVAGVYGMNFENMPELKSEWGYQVVWAIFILVPIAMVTFFKKKRWI